MTLKYRLSGSLATLSGVGSFLIILSYILVKNLRKHPYSMILWLSVSDMCLALKFGITSVIPDSENLQYKEGWCITQAAWVQFFALASVSWTGMISLNLILKLKNPFTDTSAYEKWYHVVVWTLSVTTTILFCTLGDPKPSGDGTCWFGAKDPYWRFLFYIPLVVYWILGFVALGATWKRLNRLQLYGSVRMLVIRQSLYVLVFFVCWSAPLAHQLAQWISPDKFKAGTYNGVLVYLDIIGQTSQGFWNALVWITSPAFFVAVYYGIIKKYLKCFDCWKGGNSENEKEFLLKIEQQDFVHIDAILRKNIITGLLTGIADSVARMRDEPQNITSNSPLFKEISQDKKRVYNPGDMDHLSSTGLAIETVNRHSRPGPTASFEFSFTDYAPSVFHQLRLQAGMDSKTYMSSLDPAVFLKNFASQKFSAGKSGSFFCFSPDKKLAVKTVSHSETKLLVKILPHYYRHLQTFPSSLLNRFYGCYKLKLSRLDPIYVIVINNIFMSAPKLSSTFDLKGSWVARKADPGESLGKDNDFVEQNLKIKIAEEERTQLMQMLNVDANFLRHVNIMDYSVLLGICKHDRKSTNSTSYQLRPLNVSGGVSIARTLSQEQVQSGLESSDGREVYYIGIIDVLQSYNFSKKAERLAKVYLKCVDKNGVSVQHPRQYAERFLSFFEEHIISPNDNLYQDSGTTIPLFSNDTEDRELLIKP